MISPERLAWPGSLVARAQVAGGAGGSGQGGRNCRYFMRDGPTKSKSLPRRSGFGQARLYTSRRFELSSQSRSTRPREAPGMKPSRLVIACLLLAAPPILAESKD